jgi:hypothetical protein
LKLNLFRWLAACGIILIATIHQGHAQSVSLNNGGSLSLYGLTFAISGCTLTGSSCSASGLDLQGVAAGRGNIEFQIVNSAGSSSAALSRALTGTGSGSGSTTLLFTITVSPTPGQPTTLVTSAALIDTGTRYYTCASGHSGCSATATASLQVAGSTLLSQSLTANQSALQSQTSSIYTTTGINAFSFVENVTLNTSTASNYSAGGTLRLNTVAVKFHTAPEPASIGIMLCALGGLAAARWRRRASSSRRDLTWSDQHHPR